MKVTSRQIKSYLIMFLLLAALCTGTVSMVLAAVTGTSTFSQWLVMGLQTLGIVLFGICVTFLLTERVLSRMRHQEEAVRRDRADLQPHPLQPIEYADPLTAEAQVVYHAPGHCRRKPLQGTQMPRAGFQEAPPLNPAVHSTQPHQFYPAGIQSVNGRKPTQNGMPQNQSVRSDVDFNRSFRRFRH